MWLKCEFPGCKLVAVDFDTTFRKRHCEQHSFEKVVWPSGDKHPSHIENIPRAKRSKSNQFNSRFLKLRKGRFHDS